MPLAVKNRLMKGFLNKSILKEKCMTSQKSDVIGIAKILQRKFCKVTMEGDGNGNSNNLPIINGIRPTRSTSLYRPEIIVYDKDNNITHIWEIESGDGGKSMLGAIFLADACISMHLKDGIQSSQIKPELIFVILGNRDNAMKRIDAIQPYLKTVKHIKIKIYTQKEAYDSLKADV